MSSLHRLELSYNQLEDRMILFLITQDLKEYRFWVTRRGIKILWSGLQQLLSHATDSGERAEGSKGWAEKIQQEKSQKQPGAEKFATRLSTRPFGDNPLLFVKLAGNLHKDGVIHMRLEGVDGRWLEFSGKPSILLALSELILETVKIAEWDLHLKKEVDFPPKTH